MPSDLLDLLDRPGRRSVGWPHDSDGEVAGGAVADFFFVISRRDGARSADRPARAGAAAAGRRRHLRFSLAPACADPRGMNAFSASSALRSAFQLVPASPCFSWTRNP